MNQRVRSCGKVFSLVNTQFLFSAQASASHPQDKTPTLPHPTSPLLSLLPSLHSTLCSFLFPFSNLHLPPPTVSPPVPSHSSLSNIHTVYFDFFFLLNVTVSILVTGSPHSSSSMVFCLKNDYSYDSSCSYTACSEIDICRYCFYNSVARWQVY